MSKATKHRLTAPTQLRRTDVGNQPPPSAYRIADACYQLGIGRTSLYALVKAGDLKLVKIAGRTLVPRSEIERLTSIDNAA